MAQGFTLEELQAKGIVPKPTGQGFTLEELQAQGKIPKQPGVVASTPTSPPVSHFPTATVPAPAGYKQPNRPSPLKNTKTQEFLSGAEKANTAVTNFGAGAIKGGIDIAKNLSSFGEKAGIGLERALLPKSLEQKAGLPTKGSPSSAERLIPENVTKSNNPAQQVGKVAANVGAFFIPGGQEEAGAGLAARTSPYIAKLPGVFRGAADYAMKAIPEAIHGAAVTKAEGGSNKEALGVGALSALAPAAKLLKDTVTGGKNALKGVLDIVSPKLDKRATEAAIAAGRGVKDKLGKIVIAPSTREIEMANAVKDVVKKGDSLFKNITNLKGAIKDSGEKVGNYLKTYGGIFNNTQLKGALDTAKEDSRIIFGSDKTQESAYDAVVQEMMKQMEKQKNNLDGLWKARQKFDDVIEQKFPGLLSGPTGDNIRKNAVKDVRNVVNQFVHDNLPEGNIYQDELQKMTHMYNAVDNIAEKAAPSVGTTAFSRFGKAHPLITKGLIGGATALGGALGINEAKKRLGF